MQISPRVFNHPQLYSNDDNMLTNIYLTHKEKLPAKKQSIRIDYKNGAVIINEKKINSSESKTYQAQAIIKRLLLDCNKHIVEIQAED